MFSSLASRLTCQHWSWSYGSHGLLNYSDQGSVSCVWSLAWGSAASSTRLQPPLYDRYTLFESVNYGHEWNIVSCCWQNLLLQTQVDSVFCFMCAWTLGTRAHSYLGWCLRGARSRGTFSTSSSSAFFFLVFFFFVFICLCVFVFPIFFSSSLIHRNLFPMGSLCTSTCFPRIVVYRTLFLAHCARSVRLLDIPLHGCHESCLLQTRHLSPLIRVLKGKPATHLIWADSRLSLSLSLCHCFSLPIDSSVSLPVEIGQTAFRWSQYILQILLTSAVLLGMYSSFKELPDLY